MSERTAIEIATFSLLMGMLIGSILGAMLMGWFIS